MIAREALQFLKEKAKAFYEDNGYEIPLKYYESVDILYDILNIIEHVRIDNDEKTYTLEEAKEALELGEFDNLGTDAEHIKNHIEQVDLNEKSEAEKAFDEMFGDFLEDFGNLSLKKDKS